MVRPERFELPTLWFVASDIGTVPLILNGIIVQGWA